MRKERKTYRGTDKQTKAQTDGETGRHRQTGRLRDREAEGAKDIEGLARDIGLDRQRDSKTKNQTDSETVRQRLRERVTN